MKVIIVSGTPGTGKTTYAKQLAKEKKYKYIDVHEIVEQSGLSEGKDKKRDSLIIDTDKLNQKLITLIDIAKQNKVKGLVIDSHLAHYLPKEYVDACIITKCNLKELKKRLQQRGYSEEKIRENLDAEIFDTCRVEALEAGHTVEVQYTD